MNDSIDSDEAGTDPGKLSGRSWGTGADRRPSTRWRGSDGALAILELGQQASDPGVGVVVCHGSRTITGRVQAVRGVLGGSEGVERTGARGAIGTGADGEYRIPLDSSEKQMNTVF